MKKHAYLIIAHNNFYILEKLIKLLDNDNVDIFVHVDKKVKQFDFDYFSKLTAKSDVVFTKKRIDVRWGHSSQIDTEMVLYKTAYNNDCYDYFHLISGVDLPIKPISEINNFFENTSRDYMYTSEKTTNWDHQRVSLFRTCSKNKYVLFAFNKFNNIFKINRVKKYPFKTRKGSNWCSVTNNAVKILIENEVLIKRMTRFSLCADEVYKQTILNHNIEENIVNNDLRYIDWSAGGNSPEIYNINDFGRLMSNDRLFARKFDVNTDKEIIDKIYETVSNK